MKDLRIVFMGTPDFAAAILQRLIDTKRNVVGVFSQPDKPVGRKQEILPTATKQIAMKYDIPVYQPAKLRDGTALSLMKELNPDLVVVAAYGKILPKDLLDVPPLGNVNVHGSLLPQYRGAAPIQWSVLNGDKMTGVTTMYMAEGMDTGDMILKKEIEIGENETSGQLFDRLAALGADAIEETLALFDEGKVPREIQDESKATMAPMLSKEMAEIDFTKTNDEVHNLVRGMNPWPCAFTHYEGKTLKIWETVKADDFTGDPGEVLDTRRFLIACGKGAVEVLSCQPEGKGRMKGSDFLNGKRIEKGTKIGE